MRTEAVVVTAFLVVGLAGLVSLAVALLIGACMDVGDRPTPRPPD